MHVLIVVVPAGARLAKLSLEIVDASSLASEPSNVAEARAIVGRATGISA
jgi:hypothetical protein